MNAASRFLDCPQKIRIDLPVGRFHFAFFHLKLMDWISQVVEDLGIMNESFISSFLHILQDGTNLLLKAKDILGPSSFHLGEVSLKFSFPCSKNLHKRASSYGFFFIPQRAIVNPKSQSSSFTLLIFAPRLANFLSSPSYPRSRW